MASVVEWCVCSTAVRECTGSIPAGANVVIPVFPPKATCPLSSDEYLALWRPSHPNEMFDRSIKGYFFRVAKFRLRLRLRPLIAMVAGVIILCKALWAGSKSLEGRYIKPDIIIIIIMISSQDLTILLSFSRSSFVIRPNQTVIEEVRMLSIIPL